ncbi:MAG: hypothetical protein J0M18_12385 [Ignavibacteria bacterium]|nr:hypothetical protein [Ignavibacteria bacterium]
MKKIFLVFLFFVFPLSLYSQLPSTTYISAYGGLSTPANQDLYSSSFNAGANIEFALSKLTAFGVDVNFANLSARKNEFELLYLGYRLYQYGNYSTMGFMAFFKLQNADAIKLPVQPFVKIGLGTSLIAKTGVNFKSFNTITDVPNETSTGILFAPSIGINIPIHAKNKIVIEAQYRINKSDTQDVKSFLLNFGYGFRL